MRLVNLTLIYNGPDQSECCAVMCLGPVHCVCFRDHVVVAGSENCALCVWSRNCASSALPDYTICLDPANMQQSVGLIDFCGNAKEIVCMAGGKLYSTQSPVPPPQLKPKPPPRPITQSLRRNHDELLHFDLVPPITKPKWLQYFQDGSPAGLQGCMKYPEELLPPHPPISVAKPKLKKKLARKKKKRKKAKKQ